MTVKIMILLVFLFCSGLAAAEDDVSLQNELQDEQEFQDAQLTTSAGITPDSALYFIDEFLELFTSSIENREEKIAEVREMIKAGKVKEAREALSKYKQYADETEEEVDPGEGERTRRSAIAIKKVIEDIEQDVPVENKKDFVEDVLSQEKRIATAARIADKIKSLCETLSRVDPQQYAQTCKVKEGDDVPRWQRALDQKLTQEQREEARKFFKIMSQCFRDPGSCKCEEISIKPFAEKCKVVAPLAAQCEKGDEQACEKMDVDTENIEDLLPGHLQIVMREVEGEFGEMEFENHLPPECREAGINFRDNNAQEKCRKVMYTVHAPEECVTALEQGKIDLSNERRAREQCEEISFRAYAPEECIEAGIKDGRACSKYMFKQNAPPECLEAGLTGEKPNDNRRCEEISFRANAPEECVKAGVKNFRECEQMMFPKQCLDAGLSPRDHRKCEEVMFRQNAPEECVKAGISNGRECGRHMFQLGAPKECLDAGLTGDAPNDPRKCEALTRGKQQDDRQQGPAFGRNCKEIQDASERLKCLEDFYNDIQREGFPSRGEGPHQQDNFPPECKQEGIKDGEGCGRFMRESRRFPREERRDDEPRFSCDCRDVQCSEGTHPECRGGGCECVVNGEKPAMPPQVDQSLPPQLPPEGDQQSIAGVPKDSNEEKSPLPPLEGQPSPPVVEPPQAVVEVPKDSSESDVPLSGGASDPGSSGGSSSDSGSGSSGDGSSGPSGGSDSGSSSSGSGSESPSSGPSDAGSSGSSGDSSSGSSSSGSSDSGGSSGAVTGGAVANKFLKYYWNE